MTVRILTDFHHHALAESLLVLFEDRKILGPTEVYFPIGMDWFNQGYWNFEREWHGDAVAKQYLIGVWADAKPVGDGVYVREDTRHPGRKIKGVDLESALDGEWDIVLSSLPHNDAGMHRFAQQVGARFGVQVGNNVQMSRWDLAEFIMSSSTLPESGLVDPSTWAKVTTHMGKPCVVYHQEFDLTTFRHEWPPSHPQRIGSFVNCFPEGPSYPAFLDFARSYSDQFPDVKVYGAYGRGGQYHDEFEAGDIHAVPDVADAMRACGVIWHSKHWSDGFGHTIHNAFAVGRPVVGIQAYYADKLAGPLWVEGVTSIDITDLSYHKIADRLRHLLGDPEMHRSMGEAAAKRFREIVDFDLDAHAIRSLLEPLL